MKIGGLQPVTLLDYPQKMAAIIFTYGCNMRCPFCYNPQLVRPGLTADKLYNEDRVIDFLTRRRKYLDGLVITGGEPTLQRGLTKFLAKMKKLGYAIKLDTNGLLPDVLKNLLDKGLVDYVAMDIKGSLKEYERYAGVGPDGIAESIALVMSSGLPYEFRSTLVKGWHKRADILAMAEAIKGADLYYLQNFQDGKCLAGNDFSGKPFFKKELEAFRQLTGNFVKKCVIR
ncbi:MAG: anaerobic ribonucleoside-triphosphate reductase activating protein [Patescibacteria group bacterium]|jgi:pyruvate formate lyase activating enzyme